MDNLFSPLACVTASVRLYIVLCEFNVAYLKNENDMGCLSGLGPKGNLYFCQRDRKREIQNRNIHKTESEKKEL